MKSLTMPIIFALLTALFWGVYGPSLGKARAPGVYSAFKPYLGIGLAYLVVGVIGGALMMKFVGKDSFSFAGEQFRALKWGFLAGLVGAVGALTLTLAMVQSGGKAHLVMPIVFGGAVSVNAVTSLLMNRDAHSTPWMWVGIAGVVVSVVVVAMNIPHAPSKKPTATPETTQQQSPATEIEPRQATT
jgi:hypothetical protein